MSLRNEEDEEKGVFGKKQRKNRKREERVMKRNGGRELLRVGW